MGSIVTPSELGFSENSESDDETPLGTLLAGRFADLDIDSVAAVREIREDV